MLTYRFQLFWFKFLDQMENYSSQSFSTISLLNRFLTKNPLHWIMICAKFRWKLRWPKKIKKKKKTSPKLSAKLSKKVYRSRERETDWNWSGKSLLELDVNKHFYFLKIVIQEKDLWIPCYLLVIWWNKLSYSPLVSNDHAGFTGVSLDHGLGIRSIICFNPEQLCTPLLDLPIHK